MKKGFLVLSVALLTTILTGCATTSSSSSSDASSNSSSVAPSSSSSTSSDSNSSSSSSTSSDSSSSSSSSTSVNTNVVLDQNGLKDVFSKASSADSKVKSGTLEVTEKNNLGSSVTTYTYEYGDKYTHVKAVDSYETSNSYYGYDASNKAYGIKVVDGASSSIEIKDEGVFNGPTFKDYVGNTIYGMKGLLAKLSTMVEANENKDFDGWYDSASNPTKYNFSVGTLVKGGYNITLDVYDVTFEVSEESVLALKVTYNRYTGSSLTYNESAGRYYYDSTKSTKNITYAFTQTLGTRDAVNPYAYENFLFTSFDLKDATTSAVIANESTVNVTKNVPYKISIANAVPETASADVDTPVISFGTGVTSESIYGTFINNAISIEGYVEGTYTCTIKTKNVTKTLTIVVSNSSSTDGDDSGETSALTLAKITASGAELNDGWETTLVFTPESVNSPESGTVSLNDTVNLLYSYDYDEKTFMIMDADYDPVCVLEIKGNSLTLKEYKNEDYSGRFDGPFTLTGSSSDGDSDGDGSGETSALTLAKITASGAELNDGWGTTLVFTPEDANYPDSGTVLLNDVVTLNYQYNYDENTFTIMDASYDPVCVLEISGNSLTLKELKNEGYSGTFDGPFTLTGSSTGGDSDGDGSDETSALTYETVVSSTFVSSWTSQTLTFNDETKIATFSQLGTYSYTYDETTKTFTLTYTEDSTDTLTLTINGSSLVTSEFDQYTISTVVQDMTLEEALSHSYFSSNMGVTLTFTPGTTSSEGTASLSISEDEGTYVYDETTKTFTVTIGEYNYTFTISGNTLTNSEVGTFTIVNN